VKEGPELTILYGYLLPLLKSGKCFHTGTGIPQNATLKKGQLSCWLLNTNGE
jgi:hypothetical protein